MTNSTINNSTVSILFSLFFLLLAGCASTSDKTEFVKPAYPAPPDDPRFHYQETVFSSADVIKENSDSAFRRMITGETRSGVAMSKPFSVAVYQGTLYVSDTVSRQVFAFDRKNSQYREVGTTSPGELFKPMGLDVDKNGTLYVCDSTMKHVQVYDKTGKYLRTIGQRDLFSRPSGLAVNPEGTKVFVVDTGGVNSNWHRVVVFDAVTGEFLYNISERGSDEGYLNLPREAAIGTDGNLYIVDGGNFRVQVFSQDGEFLHSFGDIGRRSGQFSRPKGIGIDKEGKIYVSDAAFGNFQIFNQKSQLLLAVGTRNSSTGPGHFMLPSGIAVDEDGRVFMVDQYFRKVDVFRPASVAENEGYFAYKKTSK